MVRLRVAYSYFPRDGLGEILGATVVDVENAAEQAETILARRAAETVEGTARGADRQVDVGFRAERNGREWLFGRRIDRREGSQVRSLHRPPSCPRKPTRFPGREKPSQFRSVKEACRGLRTGSHAAWPNETIVDHLDYAGATRGRPPRGERRRTRAQARAVAHKSVSSMDPSQWRIAWSINPSARTAKKGLAFGSKESVCTDDRRPKEPRG